MLLSDYRKADAGIKRKATERSHGEPVNSSKTDAMVLVLECLNTDTSTVILQVLIQ